MDDLVWLAGGLAALLCAMFLWRLARALYVVAQPDEWLLRVRNGALVDAGVGISRFRRPGDVVARFSSTMQRVGFALEALTEDRQKVTLEGFVFWSVSPEGDGPFRAFSRLGIANLVRPPAGLKHPKHLLTSPQHKAFQQMLMGSVQRHAATLPLERVLRDQDRFVDGLAARLRAVTDAMGVRIDQVQLLAARPSDPEVLANLSVRETERIREEAAQVRLATRDRTAQRETESATRRAQETADAARDEQAHAARAELELAQLRAKLLEEQRAVRTREAEQDRDLRLMQLEVERAVALREIDVARERELSDAARALETTRARLERETLEGSARAEGVRREAEAQRDAAMALTAAEERKAPAVREYELARVVAQTVAQAIKVTDARWVSIGNDSPAAGVAAMLAGVREAVMPEARRARDTSAE